MTDDATERRPCIQAGPGERWGRPPTAGPGWVYAKASREPTVAGAAPQSSGRTRTRPAGVPAPYPAPRRLRPPRPPANLSWGPSRLDSPVDPEPWDRMSRFLLVVLVICCAPLPLAAQDAARNARRGDPPGGANSAGRGAGPGSGPDGRGSAPERLGRVPALGHRRIVGQRFLLGRRVPNRPGDRAAALRQHHQPQPQRVAPGQRGPVHRLSARGGAQSRQCRTGPGRGGVGGRAVPAGASRRPISSSTP